MSNPSSDDYSRRQRIGIFLGPVVFLFLLLLPPPEGLAPEAWAVAGVALFMAIWWVTEAIPIPATALLPIVLFPILKVGSVADATKPFANPLIYLFMGGFIIALAMEKTNLHRRIALNIVKRVGTRPRSIIIGFMLAAAFLSMWVSNTATAMMMLPIAISIISLVESREAIKSGAFETRFPLVLLLGLAYACNIGGVGTLIGTPPNALMAAYMLDNHDVAIGFAQWMLIGVPVVIVSIPVVFLVLTRVVYPMDLEKIPGGTQMIESELTEAGSMSRAEKMVGMVFLMTALLWVTRPLLEPYIPNISDTGIAIFSAILMFLVPVNLQKGDFILSWEDVARLPWQVLILFGGGLSLARAITDTGLAKWLGMSMRALEGLPIFVLIVSTLLVIVFLTNVTTNTATAAAFLPVLASVAIAVGQDPLLLVVPAAIGASCAFMLPVATPPNAIVYGSGMVGIVQMARAGLIFNILMVFIITSMMYLLLGVVFDAL
jgi:solute carrier family 13 (sodium-dependent dicarboxylate transporter), member 2/3/5